MQLLYWLLRMDRFLIERELASLVWREQSTGDERLLTYLSSYWDLQYQPENYNFANYVTGKGYSFLSYDILGAGRSQMYVYSLPISSNDNLP